MNAPTRDIFQHRFVKPVTITLSTGVPVGILFPGTYEVERETDGQPNWFTVYGIDMNGNREPERLARVALEEDASGNIIVTF